jgi:hypothetical protein
MNTLPNLLRKSVRLLCKLWELLLTSGCMCDCNQGRLPCKCGREK